LLHELGLDASLVDEMLPAHEYHQLSAHEQWQRVAAVLEHVVEVFDLRLFPILLATRRYALDHPILYAAALVAPNLEHALDRIALYRPIWERSVLIRCIRTGIGNGIRIEFESEGGGGVGSQVLREGVVAGVLQYVRAVSAHRVRPRRVHFAHKAPRQAEAFEAFFEAPVGYDSACDAIEFDAHAMGLPTRRPDPLLSEIVLAHLNALDEVSQTALASPAERTRREVRSRLEDGVPSQRGVARALGMSERTHRRRLREAGTSYAAIIESMRMERARELLATTERPVTCIAFDLHFAGPSAFSRAFKRWRGELPSAYRARLRPSRRIA
jgi:AraC-like DNA-binding protein